MKRVCVIGLSKNAGKTTVLNYLLLNETQTAGITSIGRDGEQTDQVYGFKKPRIFIKKGTLVATALQTLKKCSCTRQILASSGVHTALGEIYIFRAISDGFVEICGCGEGDGLEKTLNLLEAFGAKSVFIDGAFSRKTLIGAQAILVTGASFSPSLEQTVEQTKFLASLFFLSNTRRLKNQIEIEGALTDTLADKIIANGIKSTIIVGSINKILLSNQKYQLLTRLGFNILTLKSTKLLSVAFNPFSPHGYQYNLKEFHAALKDALKEYDLTIFNAKEDL